ncbi:MAG: hypothetical protein V3W37_03080 [Candidatus Binatia bacterium]
MPSGRILVDPDELRRAREYKRQALADAKAGRRIRAMEKVNVTPLVVDVSICKPEPDEAPWLTVFYRKGTPKSLILRDLRVFLRARGIRDGAVSIEEDWTE